MDFLDKPLPPDAVTTFIREVPRPVNNRLTELFGVRQVDDNKVDFAEIIHTNRTAKYRSFDGRISVSRRDSGADTRVPLAPLSTSSPGIGEYERLQREFARTAGTATEALERAIYNDAENLTNEIWNRLELAWGDVLTDGKLSIDENGLKSEADYGVPANHKVAAATAWTDSANGTPLTNLQAWVDTYVETNGFAPGQILTSQRVRRAVTRSKEVIDAAYGATQGRTRVVDADLVGLLSSEGLPGFLDAYDNRFDVDGVSTRVLPDNLVVFLPPNPADLGETVLGLTATALELVEQQFLPFSEASGIVGVVQKVGPPVRKYTFVDAVGQPVLSNAKRLFAATVAA